MMRIRRIDQLVLAFLVALTTACATANQGGAGRQQDVLLADEIATVKVASLYEVIQRLRPRWLTVTSGPRSFGVETEIVVYQEQTMLGGTEILKELAPDMVREIRYVDGTKASASLPGLGSRHVVGAIVIIPR